MTTARQPQALATCPTTLPTAPEAAETTTVSPGFGSPMRNNPYHAVTPGIPITPSAADNGAPLVLMRRNPLAPASAYNCQPNRPATIAPVSKPGALAFI